MERPEVICLSGSMRFYLLMLRVAEEETANGHIVLMPFVTVHDDQPDGEHKRMLDDLHFAKIRMSDRVIVVSDESGYYGESTSREIRYAGELGLPVEHRCVSTPAVRFDAEWSFSFDYDSYSIRCNHCDYVCSWFTTDVRELVGVLTRHHEAQHSDSAPVPAEDEAAVERIARALHRGAWERDIAKGIPLEDNELSPKPHNCDRYVDVHHLVEAEIAVARLTKDYGGSPVQHDVTQVAVAVAAAFDMDLTPEAEAASQPTPSDLQVPPSLGATPTEPGPDARVWARGAPQPDGVTHILERGERHWCLNRTDNLWYMRDIAGPMLSWDDLLEGCGWVVEVVATEPDVAAPDRESLTDALREAFNTAYERSDNPRVDRMHRHDQHQYAGACHVCRGDVDVLVPHIADRLISAGLVRTPVTAEQIEVVATGMFNRYVCAHSPRPAAWERDLDDTDRAYWIDQARRTAEELGLSVAAGGRLWLT